jgi:hypothetical protein
MARQFRSSEAEEMERSFVWNSSTESAEWSGRVSQLRKVNVIVLMLHRGQKVSPLQQQAEATARRKAMFSLDVGERMKEARAVGANPPDFPPLVEFPFDRAATSFGGSEMRSKSSKIAVSLSLHLNVRLRVGLAFDIGLFLLKKECAACS